MAIKQHRMRDTHSALDEHVHLRALVKEVKQALEIGQAEQDQIVKLLQALSEEVLEHFEHEESGGYFAEVIEVAPRLSDRVHALHHQHPLMARQLADLQACAAARTADERWWRELNEHFTQFLRVFQEHESKENALLQQAYTEDIGAED